MARTFDAGGGGDGTDRLALMLSRARRPAFLVGAGLSAGSGLGTYRGKDGRWTVEEPVTARMFAMDASARLAQWRRSVSDARAFAAVEPNVGHHALARMTRERDAVILTQNVDGLHARAGTVPSRLLELHGNGLGAVCDACGETSRLLDHEEAVAAGSCPACPRDGRPLRPAVTLFGATLAPGGLNAAQECASACDLLVAVGTSLSVHTAAGLPAMARRHGAQVAIMVDAVTGCDRHASLLMGGDAPALIAAAVAQALSS